MQEKYDSMLHYRVREFERNLAEIEDKLTRSQDENDELRRKSEKIERQAWEYKHQIDDRGKREEKVTQ